MDDHDDPVRLHQPAPGIFTLVLDWPAAALLRSDPAALGVYAGPGARAVAEAHRARLRARLTRLAQNSEGAE